MHFRRRLASILYGIISAAVLIRYVTTVVQTFLLVRDVNRDRVNTQGEIVQTSGGKTQFYDVDFSDENGGSHSTTFESSWAYGGLDVGDNVTVSYKRSDPERAYVRGHVYTLWPFMVVGVGLLAAYFVWKFHVTAPGSRERKR